MTDQMEARARQTDQTNATPDHADDEIALRPYFETLWGYRRGIVLTVVGVAVLFVIGALTAFLLAPVERLGSPPVPAVV